MVTTMSGRRSIPLSKSWSFTEEKPLGPLEEIKKTGVSVFNYPVTPGARQVTTGTAPSADITPPDNAIVAISKEEGREWTAVDRTPSDVYSELLKQRKIPDHGVGMNEWEVQWISESAWIWKTEFEIPENDCKHLDLVFEGLDTICHVFVDDEKILATDNMFAGDVVDLKSPGLRHLSTPGTHTLVLYFESAFRKARALEAVYGSRIASHQHGARVYLRKAQYMWQWDWGPRMMCVGPWQPISLDMYDTKIDNVYARADVKKDLSATVKVSCRLKGALKDVEADIELLSPSGKSLHNETIAVKNGQVEVEWQFEAEELELWWPYQLGDPAMHTVHVNINRNGKQLDEKTTKTGIRRVRLIQEDLIDQPGSSWLFEINNVRMFLAGSNWIPADNMPSRITDDRYEKWLQMMVEGNQNVVRIWGGGLYEPSVFYRLCDEKGLMVMHDFAFACGQYPKHDSFMRSVEKEARYQLERLRNHPSIIFWAGNNEDYQKMEFFEKYDATKNLPAEQDEEMPGRVINERLLPRLIEELTDPAVPYQPSSPFQGRWVNDPTIGDSHMWRVWSGDKQPYQNWDQLSARFVSEFGFHGFPNQATVKHFLGSDGDSQAFPNSMVIEQHNKGGLATSWQYIQDNLRFATDLDGFAYASQLVQAECLDQAYRVWMRNFKGRGREYTAGAVVWQLNDCWPCISWSLADYFLRKKPAFYTVKRACAPLSISVKRTITRTYPDYIHSPAHYSSQITTQPYYLSAAKHVDQTRIHIWGFNSTLRSIGSNRSGAGSKDKGRGQYAYHVCLQVWDIESGEKVLEKYQREVVFAAVKATDLMYLDLDTNLAKRSVVSVKLVKSTQAVGARARVGAAENQQADDDDDADSVAGLVVARHCSWPEPLKYIVEMPPADRVGLKVEVDKEKEEIRVSTDKPIKGFVIDHPDSITIDDNCLDVIPHDTQVIKCQGLRDHLSGNGKNNGPASPTSTGTSGLSYRYYGDDGWYEIRV